MNRDIFREALIDVLDLLKFELEKKLNEGEEWLEFKTKDGSTVCFVGNVRELIMKFDEYIEKLALTKEVNDGN